MSIVSRDVNPMHVTEDEAAEAAVKRGLTEAEAEELRKEWGWNELPVVEVSLFYLMLMQFTGTMPYMLEVAAVIAAVCQDWYDMLIIVVMLLANALLGFHEQQEALKSLAKLTEKMENKICVLRDGVGEQRETRILVPGDVVLLTGGVQVPADIEWLEGDVLQVDTAALTGEGVPRKYPGQYGKLIESGTTISSGEAYGVVRNTGLRTETGKGSHDIANDKKGKRVSVFEQRVLLVVQIIIGTAVVDVVLIFLVQGLARGQFQGNGIYEVLLTCLSIIVAAIPIALPIVLQVTMALGAGKMATEFHAVITSVPALQDISSMSVLCSDKTGTLTTARMAIHAESVWCAPGFSKADIALYGVLSSSRDKKEDPIDRAVVMHYDRVVGSSPGPPPPPGDASPSAVARKAEAVAKQAFSLFERVRSVGFNPIYKRVLYEYTHPQMGKVTIAKGLPIKVMDTADGGKDDAEDQWTVENFAELKEKMNHIDHDFGKRGYKTLGISIKVNDGPWRFVGILPMIDPPRHDTESTINNLKAAGIAVKMITGDHLNIAIETARRIGMGTDIHRGEATRPDDDATKQMIRRADGFAQVLPKDKREVVEVLKKNFGYVVGMTGDGVNDAPALSAAQCGIAVHDATDAAKNAAAIILTSEGLSAIYSAVVESRRIFRKLKSYVTYRFAASIQIVAVLTILIFASNCSIDPLYIILLALFNDITMLPIAYDYQQASSTPEDPNVRKILTLSLCLGLCETVFTLIFAYAAGPSGMFLSDLSVSTCSPPVSALPIQAAIWLQMFIASELLIFSARAPSFMISSLMPSAQLASSVMAGCVLISAISAVPRMGGLQPADVLLIWVYDLLCLFVVDVIKVRLLVQFEENTEVLPDVPPFRPPSEEAAADVELGTAAGDGGGIAMGPLLLATASKAEAGGDRLTDFALRHSVHLDEDALGELRESIQRKRNSRDSIARASIGSASGGAVRRSSLNAPRASGSTAGELRPSIVSMGSLRPHNPANRTVL